MTDADRSARRRALLAFAAFAALFVGLFAPPAFAQESEDEPARAPELLLVDDGEPSGVIVRTDGQPSKVAISLDGSETATGSPRSLGAVGIDTQTVLVVDNGAETGDVLPDLVAAAVDYANSAPASEDIAIWTTGGTPRLRVGLSNEHARTVAVLQSLVPSSGPNHLWDGIRGAALELEDVTPGAANVVVFAGSSDNDSVSTPAEARAAVLTADASAIAVALYDPESVNVLGSLERLVAATPGGAYTAAESPAELAGSGAAVSEVVASTWWVGYTAPAEVTGNQIEITVDGTVIGASYVPDGRTSGAALEPFVDNGGGGLPFLEGDTARTLGLVLGAVAAGLGAYALVLLFQKDESGLNSVLQPYADTYATTPVDDEDAEAGGLSGNQLLQRAVELTEGFAERQGLLQRAEGLLERANLPLRAGEAFTAYAGIVLAALVVGFLVGGSLISTVVFALIGALIPPAAVNLRAGRRKKAFMAQLPDALQLLSSTLKAGYSFMQGVEADSQEIDDPMGHERRRIVTEAQLGRPLEDAMDALAERMDSPDFAWAVMAVKIQREVGGNLSELLLTVAETMTERERLRRDVAALTAEGKMSAIVLAALPILLGMAMWAINPDYINTLFDETIGQVLLVMSIVAALIGFGWMKKIINIDI